MGHGTATVTMHRPGADVRSTVAALATLGALTTQAAGDDGALALTIAGGGRSDLAALPGTEPVALDCGNSGTLMRLPTGAATTRAGRTTLTGDASLSTRPMERVAVPLRAMGAKVTTSDGHAPVVVDGGAPLTATAHALPVASAQVLGAIALAAVTADGATTITTPGPTRDHTERLLGFLGAPVSREGHTTTLTGPTGWECRDIDVPADPSAAAFWLVAGAIHPDADITLADVGLNPTRIGVIRILARMGARIDVTPAGTVGPEPAGTLRVRTGPRLRAVDLTADDVADVIDELPVLAVAMAAASGTSTVRDAAELRVKESDRIALTVAGLRTIGVDAEELPDGWRITGAPVRTAPAHSPAGTRAVVTTAADHRIAMAFTIADLAGVGTTDCDVDDLACADVSYPGFLDDLGALT
ncbi:MAG: 3-phosphoshikimate 1-carboxyvinyltransferase, partial [Actinomycetes bacterium]|nr:3-phosphoshikimate 1-carboxyvinyltransferase [Actinomycetes bacterium]MDX5381205.1 3-phosphoshikimate 1-carboxyvinyltransferase [Actinomycetes bacterium]MDX5400512.1 3-phosphoshikimate 1-carboxyvinyltransferase [Actinomycetes bacterium]MDX5450970.1 3-phosphoshikimate 1-carboxyvinyltransferase [Actinomycetes bacterium]